MTSKTQEGFLLFTDITGYEKFLTDVEIQHGAGIIQELLELIINHNVPPLEHAVVNGDGVLMDLSTELVERPEVILELIESTYLSFKDRVASIDRNNTCGCRACSSAPNLDLKFFVHYGQYLPQHARNGHFDLAGMDALLLKERKLKDQVVNINEPYILFTNASLDKLGLDLPDTVLNTAGYEHHGEVPTTRLNLSARYMQQLEERRIVVSQADADIVNTIEIAVRPMVIWEWLNNPYLRTRWMRARTWTELKRPSGRLGVGAQNHCGHALGNIIETVIDWHPYKYFTSMTEEGRMQLLNTFELSPSPDLETTEVHWRVKVVNLPWSRLTGPIAPPVIKAIYRQDLKFLKKLIEATEQGQHIV
ncbi:MAG: DUF2652 domain-containing protein [Anaerolineales bacterium]|jgi:hypothetical protein